ncbi:MAG TPA: amidase [Candidatus Acidoferrales bacterium]|nr:amidase [Candidatus Acidoferrales bacterium]
MTDELGRLDATAQAELLRRGKVSALELVDAAIARIERVNPQLNAVIIPLFEKARRQAASPQLPNGPFRGVPFLLKDLDVLSAGDPFHAGMRFLRDLNWVADHDSYLVEKFRAAGLVCLGKTNTPELGCSVTTEPQAYGASRNPWNTAHSTGGSSGGSAAAVASGMVPAAHASDGGGSIRIPSSECGLVGLKPSRGRVSLGPDYGEYWHGLVISHVVTRSVRDSAAILDAVAAPMPGDPYFAPPPARAFAAEVGADPGRLRIGMTTRMPGGNGALHPDCVAAAQDVARLLASLGHHVDESYSAALDEQDTCVFHFSRLLMAWVAASLDEWSQRTGKTVPRDRVEPTTWAFAEMGRAVSAAEYLGTVQWLHAYTRRMASWWASGYDLLLTPTLGQPPPLLGEMVPPPDNPLGTDRALSLVPFTVPFNITGQPAISLPLCWNGAGLPIGVQLSAAYGREDVLIRVAAQLEQARPWAHRWPPLHA